ncbi:MAG TPA: hypothetical protein VJ830_06860 [Anaerolineales bacterium]|nr:hypothetical protein [Anaerolineales bacterium]
MLLNHPTFWFNCFIVVTLLTVTCTAFAYFVNSKRPDDDPKKKHYHPLAILLAPITVPLLIISSVIFLLLRVATYGVFLVLFSFALIFIRKPFLLEWLKKNTVRIGDLLLEANTLLIRLFLGPRAGSA